MNPNPIPNAGPNAGPNVLPSLAISLCIATYRRPERLAALLDDLALQRLQPHEVVIVDNDPEGSAREVVERRRARGTRFPIVYGQQPLKNIALTRNRTVALASGDWLAFIDDDERAAPTWLAALEHAARTCGADGVLGPVEPVLPREAPAWIRRGAFYDWVRLPTGSVVPLNRLRFGNVLLRADLLTDRPAPFDTAYGQTGGEDGELLGRLVQQGARIVWCDEAAVTEPVEPARLRLRWLLLRALRGGQDYARHRISGRFGAIGGVNGGALGPLARLRFIGRAVAQAGVATLLVPLCWPTGRHRAAHWALKAAANVGKLSAFAGWHYREYGEARGAAAPRPMQGAAAPRKVDGAAAPRRRDGTAGPST